MEIRRTPHLLTASLSLTSLIDAFSILVLYLLLVTQEGITDIDLKTTVTIPKAESAAFVEKEPLVIRLEKNRIFVKDEIYTEQKLIHLVRSKIKEEDVRQKALLKNSPSTENPEKLQPLSIAIQADGKQLFKEIESLIQILQKSGVSTIELLAERSP
jgi:biopolymer transport protein ExbD